VRAHEGGEYFLAGDAAHMIAIADPDKLLDWTRRGLELADSEPEAAYWAGPLLTFRRCERSAIGIIEAPGPIRDWRALRRSSPLVS